MIIEIELILLFMNRSLSFLIFFFYFSDFIRFMRKIVFVFGLYFAFCYRWDKEERKRVRKKEKGWKEKKVIFYSIGYYFRAEYRFGVATVICKLRELGGVWFMFSNNPFQFLNNILRISIHFFTHTYFHKYF